MPIARRNYAVNVFRGNVAYDDALVLLSKYPRVYTSPNLEVIPTFDPQPTELRARRDGRFGQEDYVCHPQSHSEHFPWAPVIPRKPTSAEFLATHPCRLLWYDLRMEDWVAPLGCAFTHVGTLDLPLYTEMYVKAVEINTQAVSMWNQHSIPPEMVTAARSLFTALERLKSLLVSWRDMVLQWTQVQGLALDLVAMDSYYGYYRAQMIQRDKCRPVNLHLMGCFTTNPAVVENLYWAGIPVVYVRTEADPNAWNIRTFKVADDFWHPEDVETAEWWSKSSAQEVPCRTIWLALHGTDRIRMSRPFGRYFEDIPSLPSAPSQQTGFVFPPAPPPATARAPEYHQLLTDVSYRRSASPDAFPAADPDPPRFDTPV